MQFFSLKPNWKLSTRKKKLINFSIISLFFNIIIFLNNLRSRLAFDAVFIDCIFSVQDSDQRFIFFFILRPRKIFKSDNVLSQGPLFRNHFQTSSNWSSIEILIEVHLENFDYKKSWSKNCPKKVIPGRYGQKIQP